MSQAKAPNFEETLRQLEKLVETMESDDIELEQALKAYQKGAELFQTARQQLEKMEQNIQKLNEKMQLEPYDPNATD